LPRTRPRPCSHHKGLETILSVLDATRMAGTMAAAEPLDGGLRALQTWFLEHGGVIEKVRCPHPGLGCSCAKPFEVHQSLKAPSQASRQGL
jgi:hypothetical protein